MPVGLHVGKAEALRKELRRTVAQDDAYADGLHHGGRENSPDPLFSTPAATWKLAPSSFAGLSVPSWVRPPTGEPDAGDLHVRFGGRGRRQPLPTPIK